MSHLLGFPYSRQTHTVSYFSLFDKGGVFFVFVFLLGAGGGGGGGALPNAVAFKPS